jgi:hypothetical protein
MSKEGPAFWKFWLSKNPWNELHYSQYSVLLVDIWANLYLGKIPERGKG